MIQIEPNKICSVSHESYNNTNTINYIRASLQEHKVLKRRPRWTTETCSSCEIPLSSLMQHHIPIVENKIICFRKVQE
ncbi:hypothetical protein Hanom_Chr04g00286391 [Helianthus anomalus]